MLRTVYTPSSNHVTVPIPEKYIGFELEITIFPKNEILKVKRNNSRTLGILEGKASFSEIGDGKITMEEFLGL